MSRRWKSASPPILAVAVAGLALGACGGGGSPSINAESAAREGAVKFARCLREHGVNVTTPAGAPSGALAFSSSGKDVPAFEAAQKACARYRPKPINASPADQARMQEGALKFARCMRSHGVNVPDPTISADKVAIHVQGGPGSLNPNSAVFQAAQNACQSLLGKGAPKGSLSTSHGGGGGQEVGVATGGAAESSGTPSG